VDYRDTLYLAVGNAVNGTTGAVAQGTYSIACPGGTCGSPQALPNGFTLVGNTTNQMVLDGAGNLYATDSVNNNFFYKWLAATQTLITSYTDLGCLGPWTDLVQAATVNPAGDLFFQTNKQVVSGNGLWTLPRVFVNDAAVTNQATDAGGAIGVFPTAQSMSGVFQAICVDPTSYAAITCPAWFTISGNSTGEAAYTLTTNTGSSSCSVMVSIFGVMVTVTQNGQSATDITNKCLITQSGFTRNRSTGYWTTTLTVKNTSAGAISGPIEVVLTALSSDATMVGGSLYNGAPYVTLQSGSLNPGSSATVTLQFTDPSNGSITFTPKVYSGSL
jgi:hypothetical protein